MALEIAVPAVPSAQSRRRKPFAPNRAVHRDGLTVLALVTKHGEEIPCYLDTADYPLVQGYRWFLRRENHHINYVGTRFPGSSKIIKMHRLLLPGVPTIDHRNGLGTDNRRQNLRAATTSQNGANQRKTRGKSKYLGVCWNSVTSKYQAKIAKDKRRYVLGLFNDEHIAALTYDLASLSLHGEFAHLNILTHEYASMADRKAADEVAA
jgi:hypothetical protein